MAELVEANWILLVIALLAGIAVAFWIFIRGRRTTIERDQSHDPSIAAKRNQALIDAPSVARRDAESIAAADMSGSAMEGVAPGPVSAAANSGDTAAATAIADAEAGDGGTAREALQATQQADELMQIKGLGPRLAAQLRELGVTSLNDIAQWDDAAIDRIDAQLGRFQGRIRRDDWVSQAKMLSAGSTEDYQSKFGNL